MQEAKIIFYFIDGVLKGKLIGPDGKVTYLSTKKCKMIIRELEGYKSFIKNIKSNNSLQFDVVGNDNIIIHFILRNIELFKHHYDFRYVFKVQKEKRYKVVRNTMIGSTAVGLSAIIAFSALSNTLKMDNDKKIDSSSYSQDLEDEENKEENPIESFSYVDDTEEQKENENKEKVYQIINKFGIGSRLDTKDAMNTRREYYNKICGYCKMYNVNPDVICAIATQEQGIHDPDAPGSAIGLMQIERVHLGETITIHNYETGKNENYLITEDFIRDEDNNILIGIAIFQNCLEVFNWNYFLAIEAYNKGIGAIQRVLKRCSLATGISIEDLINDHFNFIWYDYITEEERGDIRYIPHVGSYIPPNVIFGILLYNGYYDDISIEEIRK